MVTHALGLMINIYTHMQPLNFRLALNKANLTVDFEILKTAFFFFFADLIYLTSTVNRFANLKTAFLLM